MRKFPSVIASVVFATLSALAHASPVLDPVGDFVPTYTGPQNPALDVISSEVTYLQGSHQFLLTGTMNGPIANGLNTSWAYVWGLNRGQGTERFVTTTPSTGEGVSFDSIVSLLPNGTGTVNRIVGGGSTALGAAEVSISGNTISALFDVSLLPSLGFSFDNYLWNLWPRSGAGNAAISDFAPNDVLASNPDPNAAMQRVTLAVPEPGMLLLMGIALAALSLRRLERVKGIEPSS